MTVFCICIYFNEGGRICWSYRDLCRLAPIYCPQRKYFNSSLAFCASLHSCAFVTRAIMHKTIGGRIALCSSMSLQSYQPPVLIDSK